MYYLAITYTRSGPESTKSLTLHVVSRGEVRGASSAFIYRLTIVVAATSLTGSCFYG